MRRSTDRILTTHTGSLPRPAGLVELLRKEDSGEPVDVRAFEAECEARSVRTYGSRRRMICLGYANVTEPAIDQGVRLLAEAARSAHA